MITLHQALTAPSATISFLAALRWLWLLPDWLAKWQQLAAYHRQHHHRHTNQQRATRPTHKD